jgi:hypothetical protein
MVRQGGVLVTIRAVCIDIAILLAVGAAGAGAGYVRGDIAGNDKGTATLADAKAATIAANNQKAGLEGVLASLRTKLDAQAATLRQAKADADKALRDRDTAQTQLKAETAKRVAALRTAAHESPDCADLARMPICPAVSDRLFRYGSDNAPNPASASSR